MVAGEPVQPLGTISSFHPVVAGNRLLADAKVHLPAAMAREALDKGIPR